MRRVMLVVTILALSVAVVQAQQSSVPRLINYQGRLTDLNGDPLTTGTYAVEFNIYGAKTGPTPKLWGPMQFDNGSGDGHGAKVTVINGHFNVYLGEFDTAHRPISVAFGQADCYLGIKVSTDTLGTAPEILPRQRILSSPYAFQASDADTLNKGTVRPGTGATVAQILITSKTSIGAGYAATAAPANGLIVQGGVGIGTDNLAGAKVRITGGVLNVDSHIGAKGATLGSAYYLTSAPPAEGLIVQGNVGIGVTNPSTKLQVNGWIRDKSGWVMPVGSVFPWAGTAGTAPDGWLFCEGQALSASAYPDLFGVIGYQYGGGGATFNLPNLKGRVVVGYDAGQTEFNALGKVGGEKAHTLSINEMPRHQHTYSDLYPNDDYATHGSDPYYGGDIRVGDGDGTYQRLQGWGTGWEGWTYAHNTLPPFLTLRYMIKF